MPRPRTPKAKAAITGRDQHDKGRFEDRVEPVVKNPLGPPPEWLKDTEDCKANSAWHLFEREVPWLNESHRLLVGMASKIQGQLMAEQDVGVQRLNLLRQMLGQMGASPADSSKVALPDGEEEKDDLLD